MIIEIIKTLLRLTATIMFVLAGLSFFADNTEMGTTLIIIGFLIMVMSYVIAIDAWLHEQAASKKDEL